MKKQKRLLISILTILLILTALLFLSEIPYSFRFFRKSLLKDFVSDPGDSLLYAYNVNSEEIPISETLQENLDTLSEIKFRPAPFHLISFLDSERGMSFDYKEGTIILGERYLVFLRKNKKGMIHGFPVVYQADSVPDIGKIKSFLSAYQPENTTANTNPDGSAKPPEIPAELPATSFSVYTETVPDSVIRYAEENGSVHIDMQLLQPEWLGVPYDPEKPYRIGKGYYSYLLRGSRLSHDATVTVPVLQDNHVLCSLLVSEFAKDRYTMSSSPENAAEINRLNLTDGLIVYDRSGDCFYVTAEKALLLNKGSLSFHHGTNLVRIAKTRANAPQVVRKMLSSGKLTLIEEK